MVTKLLYHSVGDLTTLPKAITWRRQHRLQCMHVLASGTVEGFLTNMLVIAYVFCGAVFLFWPFIRYTIEVMNACYFVNERVHSSNDAFTSFDRLPHQRSSRKKGVTFFFPVWLQTAREVETGHPLKSGPVSIGRMHGFLANISFPRTLFATMSS